jgi:hypothetical protein
MGFGDGLWLLTCGEPEQVIALIFIVLSSTNNDLKIVLRSK